MDIKNCRGCGKIFAAEAGDKLCPDCLNEREEKFEKVKNYLWDNPNETVAQVQEATGVEKELIKEGRLDADRIAVNGLLNCERCGVSISSGRYCSRCTKKLTRGFSDEGSDKKEERSKSKDMYTKDRINDRRKNKE